MLLLLSVLISIGQYKEDYLRETDYVSIATCVNY